MPRKYFVTLTPEEQDTLRILIDKRSAKALEVKRAYVLLALDENRAGGRLPDKEIRARYRVAQRSIERARERFVEESLERALSGKVRTQFKEKSFDGRVEAELIALRCQSPPEGAQQWTLRLLAGRLVELGVVESISHESVRQLLKKTS
jgi:hypothetical protein